MPKVIDYTLVGSNDHSAFISFVKQHITEGWQPYEAPFTTLEYQSKDNSKAVWFFQAMVKYETEALQ